MLNNYEIAMLITIAASFVFMMWRLFRALEQEKREKEIKSKMSCKALARSAQEVKQLPDEAAVVEPSGAGTPRDF